MDAAIIKAVADFGLPIALAIWLLLRDRETQKEARDREKDQVTRIRQLEEQGRKDMRDALASLASTADAMRALAEAVNSCPHMNPDDETKEIRRHGR